MSHLSALSLKLKLALLATLLFICGIAALVGGVVSSLRDEFSHVIWEQQSTSVNNVAHGIAQTLRLRTEALEVLAPQVAQLLLHNPQQLPSYLEGRVLARKIFSRDLYVISDQAVRVADAPARGLVGTSYADTPYVRQVLNSGQTVVEPRIGRFARQPVLVVAVPLRNPAGQVIGVLAGSELIASGSPLYFSKEMNNGRAGALHVVDVSRRLFVTSTRQERVMQPVPQPGHDALLDQRLRGDLTPGQGRTADGQDALGVAARVPVASVHWLVLAELPTQEALGALESIKGRIYVVASVASVLVGLLFWLKLRHELAPLEAAARQLSRQPGLFDGEAVPAFRVAGSEEVRLLLERFNQLLERSREQAQQLQEERRQLADKVTQRTRDLTLANEVLQARAQEIESLYNDAPCGYHSLDEQGRIVSINETELNLLGYTRTEVLGRPLAELMTPRGQMQFAQRFPVFLRSGRVRDLDYELVAKDGRIIPVLISADLVRDADGHFAYTRAVVVDNSERLARDRRIADMQTELARRTRAAEAATQAKSEFLANMSHEIRTPMNAIVGLTALLRRDVPDPQGQTRLAKVAEAANHLLQVINDILDFSKIEAGRLELTPVDFRLSEVIGHALSLLSERAHAKGLVLSVQRPDDVPEWLHGDAMRLTQVLLNLLGNAVKFTAQGSVTLRMERLPASEAPASRPGDVGLRFVVADTGPGIAPEVLPRLFVPFTQADGSTTRHFGGTGLGLAITRRLAELMSGAVGASSQLGQGSEFWVSAWFKPAEGVTQGEGLPFSLVHGRVPAPMPAPAPCALPAGVTVLLAEDNPVNQEVALELLHEMGVLVTLAANGREAVEICRQALPDLILMDLQMPEMDGLEATRQIRALPDVSRVPIIAMTANAFASDRAACLAVGMDDHLAKPVSPDQLRATLLRWLPGPPVPAPPAPAHTPERPEAAAPAAPVDLDVATGLRYVAGQRSLYLRLLRQFAEGLPGQRQALQAQLAGAQWGLACRTAHTLKGSAATLGAQRLMQAAAALEQVLRPASEAQAPPAALLPAPVAELEALWLALDALPAQAQAVFSQP